MSQIDKGENAMLSAGVEQERPVAQGAATMEITVSRQDLLRELSATQSVVERKTTIPILSNFPLEAGQGEGDTDRLTITATDLDQSIRTSCAAKVKKPGACTIGASHRAILRCRLSWPSFKGAGCRRSVG